MSTGPERKPLVWIAEEVKSPPFSRRARKVVGDLLSDLQDGLSIGMPASRPMPSIGARVHELRIADEDRSFRIIYRIHDDAIHIVHVFEKRTRATPKQVIAPCKRRISHFDS